MQTKKLKISPVPEDSTFYKVYAHILLLWPFVSIIIAIVVLVSIENEIRAKFIEQLMRDKIF